MRPIAILSLCLLTACSGAPLHDLFARPRTLAPVAVDPDLPPPPPEGAATVEEFDTTSQADRDAALAPVAQAASLGFTVATLGSPTEPGFWLRTPLVTQVAEGRVEYQGRSLNLELRPSGGDAGSGSQLSLAAMRLLDAPLTGLIEIEVFRR
jgi:hypothetical protein